MDYFFYESEFRLRLIAWLSVTFSMGIPRIVACILGEGLGHFLPRSTFYVANICLPLSDI